MGIAHTSRVSVALSSLLALGSALTLGGCGSDDARDLGVGSACANSAECPEQPNEPQLECLPFKGGYCGLEGCAQDADCPVGSACIDHEGTNYCFLVCIEKAECNLHRPAGAESNCSSNVTFVDGADGRKACVPPS